MEEGEKNQIRKPVGVYILTICIFLRFGVFQLIRDLGDIHDAESQTPFLIAVILIGRNVFVAATAVWAYFGENAGRISLLAIISLNVLWTIFSVITFFSYEDTGQNVRMIGNILFNPVFWLILCWWYLNRENVVKYYKRNE